MRSDGLGRVPDQAGKRSARSSRCDCNDFTNHTYRRKHLDESAATALSKGPLRRYPRGPEGEPPRDCRRLHSNLPSHAPLVVWPRVTHGACRGRVRGTLPGCASPVLAIGGAHLLSAPRSRTGPVGAAQRDRVPEMPSRRLVASTPIRPIVKLPVRSLRRRHLHPYTRRFPSRSGPARCRLLHDLAHAASRGEPLTPLAWAGLPAPS